MGETGEITPGTKVEQRYVMRHLAGVFLVFLMGLTGAAVAQDVGRVTNLPIPRYVSMKASEANVRRGPSLNHRIDWVFHRRNTPLQVTAEYGHWRRVRDVDGAGGWVHYSLLSGVRHVLLRGEKVALLRDPQSDGQEIAYAEDGVIAKLGKCGLLWCKVNADRQSGWVHKENLWGVEANEVRN